LEGQFSNSFDDLLLLGGSCRVACFCHGGDLLLILRIQYN
jgi:hypothetical protein